LQKIETSAIQPSLRHANYVMTKALRAKNGDSKRYLLGLVLNLLRSYSHPMTSSTQTPPLTVLADIGGTYARFAIVEPSANGATIQHMHRYETAATTFPEAVRDYVLHRLSTCATATTLDLRIAVAAPVLPDQTDGTLPVRLTNNAWVIGKSELADTFPNAQLTVLNDFAAVALALPYLLPDEVATFAAGAPPSAALPKLAIGPGTGLGVATIMPVAQRWQVVPGEGGHVTLAASNEREQAVIAYVQRQFDHVSAERLLSGTGLPLLHEAVCKVDGATSSARSAPEISAASLAGEAAALATLQTFAMMLGSVAGNAALTVGALGGVYLAGGLIQRWQSLFPFEEFMRAFVAKGRFKNYLERVPVYRIEVAEPGLVGLARGLSVERSSSSF
jgi:glucokinase